jgi:hypothetical protein
MNCLRCTLQLSRALAAALGLLCLATGCETVERYSLTHKLWTNADLLKYSEPAPNPNVALFDAQDRRDVLVLYDASSERHTCVERHAYFLKPNLPRISAGKKPQFVDPAVANGMKSVPMLNSASAPTNSAPRLAGYAVQTSGGRGFRLCPSGEPESAFDLPVYIETFGTPARIVLTPFAVAGDTVMVGGVATVALFFAWLEVGAPGVNVH